LLRVSGKNKGKNKGRVTFKPPVMAASSISGVDDIEPLVEASKLASVCWPAKAA
jgi:hypothetical protein